MTQTSPTLMSDETVIPDPDVHRAERRKLAMLVGIMAGLDYWWPKICGWMLNDRRGKAHFWTWFVGFNLGGRAASGGPHSQGGSWWHPGGLFNSQTWCVLGPAGNGGGALSFPFRHV